VGHDASTIIPLPAVIIGVPSSGLAMQIEQLVPHAKKRRRWSEPLPGGTAR